MQSPATDWSRPRAAIAAVAGLSLTPLCLALSFGGERVTSALGQPLRMTIPLLGTTTDALDPQCFRVVPPIRSDGLAVLTQARIELQTSSTPPLLIIRGNRILEDPIIRVAVEAGCDTPIRREYTVLLDPPSLKEPAPVVSGASASGASSGTATATPPASADPAAAGMASAGNAGGSRTGSEPRGVRIDDNPRSGASRGAQSPAAGRSRNSERQSRSVARDTRPAAGKAAPAPVTAPMRDELRLQNSGAGSVPIEDASLAALAVPRLRISSDLAMVDPGSAPAPVVGGDELQTAIARDRRARLFATPIEEDLAPRLEADLVVAKRRLAEMQAQLTAAGIAASTGSPSSAMAPGNATKPAATVAATDTFEWRNWLWVPGIALVAGLIGFMLRQRRQQQQKSSFAAADAVTVVSTLSVDDEFDTVLPTRTVTRSSPPTLSQQVPSSTTAQVAVAVDGNNGSPFDAEQRESGAARDGGERIGNPLFELIGSAPNLDVSELSHITDEAQVYADLGRNDQAIELLRAHIDEQVETDRSSPAPWLMIFDLYRRTNNRAGYDELAPRFRKNFNGRMPDWDNYGHELALDDGIEAFPHLVARIERDWGTPAARKFLDELLYDNRGGSRLGFSLAAYRDILLLMQVHDAMAPASATASHNDWESRGADDNDGTPKWDLELEMIEPPKPGELDAFISRPPPDKG